jgi:hypothetical protein
LCQIEGKIKIYNHIRGKLSSDRIISNNTEFISLFEQLKLKYIENIQLFNKLDGIKLENGNNLLKVEDSFVYYLFTFLTPYKLLE